jgi:hypothetical protein
MWNFKETRAVIDKAGWQYTKNLADEYGQSPRPKAYDDVSLPRSAHKSYNSQPRYPPPTTNTPDDTHDLEMRGYALPNTGGDTSRSSPGAARASPGAARASPEIARDEPSPTSAAVHAPPEYAKVNKNRKNVPEGQGQDEADSWV